MSVSARYGLPFLVPGQAQKELFHNEALQLLDILVQPVVEDLPKNDPLSSPSLGHIYLVGPNPNGAWTGEANALACMTEGGWRFFQPFGGMEVRHRATSELLSFIDGSWKAVMLNVGGVRVAGRQVLSTQAPAIADPGGGSTVDVQARSTLAAVLSALRQHGLIGST